MMNGKNKNRSETMAKYLYGVFLPSKTHPGTSWRWAMTTNKALALREVRKEEGGEVRRMIYPTDTLYWDAPTFYTCSERIWPVEMKLWGKVAKE
jgi:hypothetical protein